MARYQHRTDRRQVPNVPARRRRSGRHRIRQLAIEASVSAPHGDIDGRIAAPEQVLDLHTGDYSRAPITRQRATQISAQRRRVSAGVGLSRVGRMRPRHESREPVDRSQPRG